MPVAMAPDWFGGPQHLVAGFVLAVVVVATARWRRLGLVLSALLAAGAVGLAECLVEIAEYPLLYGDGLHRSAYVDTVADLADTLVGGAVGILAAVTVSVLRASRRR